MFCINRSNFENNYLKGGIKMKKFFAMMICVIMLFGLVACGDGDPEASFPSGGVFGPVGMATEEKVTTTEEVVVTTTEPALSYEEAKAELDELFRYIGTSDDVAKLLNIDSSSDSPMVLLFIAKINSKDEVDAVRDALYESTKYIKEETQVGLFIDVGRHDVLQIGKFDRHHRNEFGSEAKFMGYTHGESSAYEEIVMGLEVLIGAKKVSPGVRPVIFMVTDGIYDSDSLSKVVPIAEGIGIPVYTVLYESGYYSESWSDLAEAKKLSEVTNAQYVETDKDGFAEDFLSLLEVALSGQ